MKFFQGLFRSDINPLNNKSRTLPILNPKDKYGRTFHLSWIGYFVAFISWFAFPPLIHNIIQKDMQLTRAQVATSNTIALVSTLLTRFTVGPLCDKYGPRYVMVACLLIGSIPTALVPLITNATGLFIIRFFIGILGGTFVPCQVWTGQFFDKNIVGFATALSAGFGNSGGGVTLFLMPAVVSSLIHDHNFSEYWAWRLAFPMCPLVIILIMAMIVLIFGHDTPTGSWNQRIESNPAERVQMITELGTKIELEDETPRAPTFRDIVKTTLSLQTALVALSYFCTFGTELAIEGIISDFYIQTARNRDGVIWSYTRAGYWAAAYGLLNIFARPFGGFISDVVYRKYSIIAKKWLFIVLVFLHGVILISIGLTNLKIYPLICLMTIGGLSAQAANGAIFGLVPLIHSSFSGIVSGVTGASGNIGGIIFNFVFLLFGSNYLTALCVIGVYCSCSSIIVSFIPLKKKE